ncbi:MAG TPA: hypothetical protein VMJ32_09910 [Pirellulales bacterium]|nr:hypothetical protein [Pirellulales bacterium]
MSLFGSSRDDRRRRNLAEDLAGESFAPSAAGTSKPAGKPERYTASARRENHRHTTDFIPRSWLTVALWYVAALAAVGGLLFGYVRLCDQARDQSNSLGLAPLFDAANGGSLAGWFSSLLFGFSAAGSVLIYSIRRHKLDDYRGRYRLWLWSAVAWLVMSIDATANLHTPFALAMAHFTGWSMLAGGAIWWIGIWGGIVGILALRLLLEVRESRTATLGFTLAFSLWAAALATDYGWLHLGQSPQMSAALVAIAGRLVGQVTLFFTIALYARHVLLDAEGLLTLRQRKLKREKAPKKAKAARAADQRADSAAERLKSSRIDAAHKTPASPSAAPLAAMVQRSAANSGSAGGSTSTNSTSKSYGSSADDDDRDSNRYSKNRAGQNRFDDEEDEDDSDSYGAGRKLSKAERKRLRKQMRRQQREDDE